MPLIFTRERRLREELEARRGRWRVWAPSNYFWELFLVYIFIHPFILKLVFPYESLTCSHNRRPCQMCNKQQAAPSLWAGGPWPQSMRSCRDLFVRKSRLESDGSPVPLTTSFQWITGWLHENQWPLPHDTPYQDLPPREGSLECGGWKWLIHQKSLSLGHADSISCCSEPPLPPEHVKRVPVIHGPMFLFSLKGPDSELLEKWGSSLELCHWKKWTIPTTLFLWQFSRSMEIQCTGSGPHRVMMRVIPVQFWARGLAENSTNAAATAAIVFVVAVWSWVPRQVKGFTFFFSPLQTPYTQLSMSWTQGWWGHGARKHQKA